MLQLPMEPVGYPARNPGPKTLLARSGDDDNRDALLWHMSRFAGYTGITNYMGGRFLTASRQPAAGAGGNEEAGPGVSRRRAPCR